MLKLKCTLDDYKQYFSPAMYKTTDLMIERGKGAYVYTTDGEEYLDFVQGIAVEALGHAHPKVVKAIQEQVEKLLTASFNLVWYPTSVEFGRRLAEKAPEGLDTIFFSNGGAEAVDTALKAARYYTNRPGIIAFRGSFHGRTFGAASVTGSSAKYRKNYEPLVGSVYFTPYPYCYRCPYNTTKDKCSMECFEELERIFEYLIPPENVGSIIMEPVMGEGGYIVPPKAYLEKLRKLCDDNGIVLIFDEIQAGYGRTGKMWASQNFGVVPDLMTSGKAIAGGLPMSAVIGKREILGNWPAGAHGTTFGGNPVCAAAGLAVLDAFEEEHVLENCQKQGEYLMSQLLEMQKKYPVMGDVRGLGLMVGVEFVHPEDQSPNPEAYNKIWKYCFDHKYLILGCGVHHNGMRFASPLNVKKEEIDKALGILEGALQSL
ncbi:MAG TPA: aspartate aminotransferase family protein [Syntrophomonadaceae bacterium]|nr:aspartate aminotransferase family protein [Syntrophomonadaceae bacterium]